MKTSQSNLDKFDHIVVLMLENHSLDSLAGYIYGPGLSPAKPSLVVGPGGPDYNGVAGKTLCNSITIGGQSMTFQVKPAPFDTQADMSNPFPDPGEVYSPHINTQVYGQDPLPNPLPQPAPMSGFVKDYYEVVQASMGYDGGLKPTPEQLQVIMNSYPNTEDSLPVLSGLARSFAVSDEWFCSVPSQTFCNRSFFNSGSSHGYVSNGGGFGSYGKWLLNDQKTVFDGLHEAGLQGRVYFDKQDAIGFLVKVPVSATALINPRLLLIPGALVHYEGSTNTAWPDTNSFLKACREGSLPEYSFIEPRLMVNHNDMHPPFGPLPELLHQGATVESSILAGEWLLNNVYNAVMSGPKWDRTLLVITFDEHGGCYDHVAPPTDMIAPDDSKGEDGFDFTRFGVRVPMILVSAYIQPGTVFRAPEGFNRFDHTSMIKTLCNKWNLTSEFGARAASPLTADVSEALTLSQPRRKSEMPTFTPRPYVPRDLPSAHKHGLTGLQRDIVGLAAAHASVEAPKVDTVGEALAFLRSSL